MFAHARHQQIVSILEKHQKLEVRALMKLLGVSAATLRRDLTFLGEQDRVVRVHGGVFHPDAIASEPTFGQKATMAIKAKRTIAQAVAATIQKSATVFIDSGSTCLEAGRILRAREDLTIITNSLPLLATFTQFRAKLIVLGGEMRHVSAALVGDLAISALGRLRADVALLGASSLHPADGAGTTELTESSLKREWIRRSARRVLLADSSKWNQSGLIVFGGWDEFDEMFTNAAPPNAINARHLKIILP